MPPGFTFMDSTEDQKHYFPSEVKDLQMWRALFYAIYTNNILGGIKPSGHYKMAVRRWP